MEKLKSGESYVFGDFRIMVSDETITIHNIGSGSISIMPFSENKISITKTKY